MAERLFDEPTREELGRLQLEVADQRDYASYCGAEDPSVRDSAWRDVDFYSGVIDGICLSINPGNGRMSIVESLEGFSKKAENSRISVEKAILDQNAYFRGFLVAAEVATGRTYLPGGSSDLFAAEARIVCVLKGKVEDNR
jgi:hypothetical protein